MSAEWFRSSKLWIVLSFVAGVVVSGVWALGGGTLKSGPPATVLRRSNSAIPSTSVYNAVPPDELDIALAECERRARRAQVIFESTRTMQVGRVDQVIIHASVGADRPAFAPGANTTIEELTVHCDVEASLRGVKFAIDPVGFRPRSFVAGPTVSWTWDVEPKEAGQLRLTLEVRSVLRDRTGAVDEFTTEVLVEAKPRSIPQRVNDAIVGFVTHPVVQFFGAGAFLGAVGYFLRRKRKPPSGEPGRDPPSRASRRRRRDRRRRQSVRR